MLQKGWKTTEIVLYNGFVMSLSYALSVFKGVTVKSKRVPGTDRRDNEERLLPHTFNERLKKRGRGCIRLM